MPIHKVRQLHKLQALSFKLPFALILGLFLVELWFDIKRIEDFSRHYGRHIAILFSKHVQSVENYLLIEQNFQPTKNNYNTMPTLPIGVIDTDRLSINERQQINELESPFIIDDHAKFFSATKNAKTHLLVTSYFNSNQNYVSFAIPNRNNSGRLVGITTAKLDLNHFANLIKNNDAILYQPDFAILAKDATVVFNGGRQSIHNDWLQNQQKSSNLSNINGKEKIWVGRLITSGPLSIISYTPIANTDLGVVTSVPLTNLFSDFMPELLAYLFFAVALLFATSIVAKKIRQAQRSQHESRKLFADAISVAGNGFLIFNNQHKLEHANAQAFAILEAISSKISMLNTHLKEILIEVEKVAKENGCSLENDWAENCYRRLALFGDRQEISLKNKHILFEGRKADEDRLVMILIDISDVKARENQLIELNRKNRQLWAAVESTSSGLVLTDPKQPGNPIIYTNNSFCSLTGYSAEESVGRNCRFLQGPQTDRVTIAKIGEAIRTRTAITTEILNYKKDGAAFWNELTIAPVFDDEGKIDLYVGIQQDITNRKILQTEITQKQKLEALGQLAGGVAHDFNNALGIIHGYTELIKKKNIQDEQSNDYLERIKVTCERAAVLVKQLLAFSRKKNLSEAHANVTAILNRQKDLIQPLLGSMIDFEINVENNLHAKVNPELFEQAIINLVINARDAITGAGNIKINACKVESSIVIKISDNGHGMSNETRQRIFEPFFTTKEQGKGTGLGLAMVYGVVNEASGQINVDSIEGSGTTFTILLPYIEENRVDQYDSDLNDITNNKTILIVDDEEDFRNIFAKNCQELGMNTLVAKNGNDALLIQDDFDGKIDYLLTDVVMPEMHGGKLAELFLSLRPETKIIFITGYPGQGEKGQINLPDNSLILTKPVKQKEFLAALYS